MSLLSELKRQIYALPNELIGYDLGYKEATATNPVLRYFWKFLWHFSSWGLTIGLAVITDLLLSFLTDPLKQWILTSIKFIHF
ncbi:hypothetical protein JCM14124_08480 [Humidesulfovibrio idahonensis]